MMLLHPKPIRKPRSCRRALRQQQRADYAPARLSLNRGIHEPLKVVLDRIHTSGVELRPDHSNQLGLRINPEERAHQAPPTINAR